MVYCALLPLVLYGPINALLITGYNAGGFIAKALKSRGLPLGVLGLLMVGANFCMLFHVLGLTIVALLLLIACGATLDVTVNRWFITHYPSNIRAGASSAVVTIGYGLFLPFGLLRFS